jgi:puromycin-sensitive aminopeptidase
LEPNLEAATFTGHVIVDAAANEAAPQILLNAAELEVASVRVNGADASFHLDDATERLVVDHAVDVGAVVIEITFSGTLNDKLRGWYRSTYKDADGVEHVIATSQMQATDCRRAFPCFDEPDFKAIFDITLIVEPHLLAVSNGPEIERTEQPNGTTAVRFAETMPMSTYLVAVVVGPLEATEPVMVPRSMPVGSPEPAEDDGWVLCMVWNGARCASDLVILDAASMEELAVVELPLAIPYGLHGSFVEG